MKPRKIRSRSVPYASRPLLPTVGPPGRDLRSGLFEEYLAEVRLGARARVIGVDADRDCLDLLVGILAVDLLVVLADIAGLGQPLAEVGLAQAHDDVGDEPGLLALEHAPGRRRRVPDVPDDAGAHGRRKAGEGDVDLRGLVVGRLLASVGALGKLDHLPAPLQDLVVLAVDLDFLVDGGAVAVALHVQPAQGAFAHDLEVVARTSPVLGLPARGYALLADGRLGPVLDDEGPLSPDYRGRGQQHGQDNSSSHGVSASSGKLI